MNIPARCLILGAVFIQAQRGDTSEAVWSVKTKEQSLDMWHMQGTRNRSLISRNSHGPLSPSQPCHTEMGISLLISVEMDRIFRQKKQGGTVNKWFVPKT